MRRREAWSNRQVAMVLMACAAGLYALSVVVIQVRN